MAFRGLFIGIDRYASPDVNWLSCATRDAKALHALFSDTLGGTSALVLDDQATRAAIEREFGSLAKCDPDDVVVIAFSGHGSDTHELVTYDTTLSDLAGTTIPLDSSRIGFRGSPHAGWCCCSTAAFQAGWGPRSCTLKTHHAM